MYGTYTLHSLLFVSCIASAAGTRRPRRRATIVGGAAVALAGGALVMAGMRRFNGPRQVSGLAVGDLVTEGVYRWSRNPQYVGWVWVLAGTAVAAASPAAVALAAAYAALVRWWVGVEERHLETTVGEPYNHYRSRTPRWFGPCRD